MVVLPSTGASRYHNSCIDGGTSSEYIGCTLVYCFLSNVGKQYNQLEIEFLCALATQKASFSCVMSVCLRHISEAPTERNYVKFDTGDV
jgi:hypothetical protein